MRKIASAAVLILVITTSIGTLLAQQSCQFSNWTEHYVAADALQDVAYGANVFVAPLLSAIQRRYIGTTRLPLAPVTVSTVSYRPEQRPQERGVHAASMDSPKSGPGVLADLPRNRLVKRCERRAPLPPLLHTYGLKGGKQDWVVVSE